MEDLISQLKPWLQGGKQDVNLSTTPRDRCTEYELLVKLLQQYPGGLTMPVILTQLQSAYRNQVNKSCSPTAYVQTLADQLPLASCCSADRSGTEARAPLLEVIVAGNISSITSVGASGTVKAMQLVDGSSSTPVHMFVHSQHSQLCQGPKPLLSAGCGIRAATTLCRNMIRDSSNASSMPTLMPSLAMVIAVPAQVDNTWQQQVQACVSGLLWQSTLPDGQQHQQLAQQQFHTTCFQLGDVLAGGMEALGGQVSCPLNGWLLAQVSSVGQIQDGYAAAGGAESRTWHSCFVNLTGLEGHSSSDVFGKQLSQPVLAGSSIKWLLLDDAVRFRRLLQPGELVALHCPTVRRWQEAVGVPAELILECRESLLLLVRDNSSLSTSSAPPAASAAPAAAVSAGAWLVPSATAAFASSLACQMGLDMPAACTRPEHSSSNASGIHLCTTVVPGQSDMVLCGVVARLERITPENQPPAVVRQQQGGAAAAQSVTVHCLLAASAADLAAGRTIQLFLHCNCCNRVLHDLRDGHTLLVVRADSRLLPDQQKQSCVVWDENTPGAVVQDLSCLPALLTTPCLQQVVSLQQLAAATASMSGLGPHFPAEKNPLLLQPGPWLLYARIQAVHASTCHLHRTCGRKVHPLTDSSADTQTHDDGVSAVSNAPPAEDHLAWLCKFCGHECSIGQLTQGVDGSMWLADIPSLDGFQGHAGPALLEVAIDTAAWPLSKDPAKTSTAAGCDLGQRTAGMLKGAAVMVSPYLRQQQDQGSIVGVAALKLI